MSFNPEVPPPAGYGDDGWTPFHVRPKPRPWLLMAAAIPVMLGMAVLIVEILAQLVGAMP